MQLRKIQREFFQTLVNNLNPERMKDSIKHDSPEHLAELIAIYKNSAESGLIDSLDTTYPVCKLLVGDAFFRGMCRTYIEEHIPGGPNLNDYGFDFSQFIEQFEPAKEVEYLSDMAQLEWALHYSLIGPDSPQLDLSLLEKIPEEEQEFLVFRIVENSTLLKSKFPVDEIWQIHQDGLPDDHLINIPDEVVHLYIWRDGYELRMDRLDEDEYLALQILANPRPYRENCEIFMEKNIDFVTIFPKIVQCGYISSFSLHTH